MSDPITERNTTIYGFQYALGVLLARINSEVRRGEVSERRLARLTGYSQPHIHNVLHGIRGLQPALADRCMEVLGLTLREVLTSEDAQVDLLQRDSRRRSPVKN